MVRTESDSGRAGYRGVGRDEEWFAHQLRAFRQIAPARRASLRELLGADHPSVETLGGSRHYFRRADLEAASSKLPGELWDSRAFPLRWPWVSV
jgi:uncharacterized protein (UPF0216 family)